jgi:hypothetical protein
MITNKDITDGMVLDFLRELNVHVSKTELAVAYNTVQKHLNHNAQTPDTLATTHPSQLPVEQDTRSS